MAIKKYVAISYCFAFLFVYFSSIAYALLSTSINIISNKTMLPQTIAMNATSSALSSFTGGVSSVFMIIGLAVLVIALIFIINSIRSMGQAI